MIGQSFEEEMRSAPIIALLLVLPMLVSPAHAESCGLCAKRVVVVPATAPCLRTALDEVAQEQKPFVAFDLSKCGSTTATRGIVPGLPDPQANAEKPTVRFVLPRAQLTCLRERFVSAQQRLDPYAVISLTDCE